MQAEARGDFGSRDQRPEPLSSVSSLEVHFDLLDLTELTDMSDQELAEVFADSDEENVAGEGPGVFVQEEAPSCHSVPGLSIHPEAGPKPSVCLEVCPSVCPSGGRPQLSVPGLSSCLSGSKPRALCPSMGCSQHRGPVTSALPPGPERGNKAGTRNTSMIHRCHQHPRTPPSCPPSAHGTPRATTRRGNW
ncbi:dysbindin domain-containing protein 1 isoform X2 [Apus apus]|uniref:dysbindin domain-containing protein 1 isoform X2 n=1 Tax=Apus apus TaxID=8895 RepID=UPI0021F82920|nr:dysbindin domain-containing protein 1 isoform X2 [Apus apus]